MPMYDYKCQKCEIVEQRIVKFSDADSQKCKCEEEADMVRVMQPNPINFMLKGNWFRNGGRY